MVGNFNHCAIENFHQSVRNQLPLKWIIAIAGNGLDIEGASPLEHWGNDLDSQTWDPCNFVLRRKKRQEPLQHTYSLLCDQAEENISTHPRRMCVQPADLDPDFTSGLLLLKDLIIAGWWWGTIKCIPRSACKGLNSLSILVAWGLWKHRNTCVLEGARPSIEMLLQSAANESNL